MKDMHERVLGVRARVQWILRAVGLAAALVGLVLVLGRVFYGVLGTGSLRDAWRAWTGVGAGHGVFLGVPLVGVGAGLAVLAPRAARWIVRPPEHGCAACGHGDLDDTGRCSECGRCG